MATAAMVPARPVESSVVARGEVGAERADWPPMTMRSTTCAWGWVSSGQSCRAVRREGGMAVVGHAGDVAR